MAEDIKKIVEQLTGYPPKEGLPEIVRELSTKERIKLVDDNWEIITRGLRGTRRNPMISQGEAAWLVELAGEYQPDIEFLEYFIRKKGDIPYSSEGLRNLFSKYLDHFVNNPKPSEATEVTTLNTRNKTPQHFKVTAPNIPLSPYIKRALSKIVTQFQSPVAEEKFSKFARDLVRVIAKLNAEDQVNKLLLSKATLYQFILSQLLFKEEPKGSGKYVESEEGKELLKDRDGFAFEVKRKLQDVRGYFVRQIVDGVIKNNKIKLEPQELENLAAQIDSDGLKLGPKNVEPQVLEANKLILEEGDLNKFVKKYVERDEIKQEKFTEDIERRMVSHLLAAGVNIADESEFNKGQYDEYFAIAYNNATSTSEGTMYGSPAAGGWDFSVDTFDEVIDQTIIPENILAAGFLDYSYELGEKAHIFQLMDVLYLNWNRGILDLPQSEVTDTLERLWQDKERRNTPEERGMSYRKTLGKGNVEVLDRMIVNEQFEDLWATLMEEVANYIRKAEEISVVGDGAAPVSRIPIYQATKELQYNLTEYGNGRTKTQAAQLRSLLDTCFNILDSPEIIDFYGFGTRRDRWTVIDRLHKEPPFESVPNLSALKTVAGKGNKVFQWIADFNEATVSDDDFETLIRSGEAWIIAQGAVPQEEDGFSDDDEGFDDFEDDEEFDDFED